MIESNPESRVFRYLFEGFRLEKAVENSIRNDVGAGGLPDSWQHQGTFDISECLLQMKQLWHLETRTSADELLYKNRVL